MSDQCAKYASVIANAFVEQNMQHSFYYGKYIDLELCRSACLHYFMQFALLSSMYATRDYKFIYVIGAAGNQEVDALSLLKNIVDTSIIPLLNGKSTSHALINYINETIDKELGALSLIIGKKIISCDVASKVINSWAMYGAYLGLKHSDTIVDLYCVTHNGSDNKLWSSAYRQCISTTQDVKSLTIEQLKNIYKQQFQEFCSQHYPELVTIFSLTIDPFSSEIQKQKADDKEMIDQYLLGRTYDSSCEDRDKTVVKDDVKAAVCYRKAADLDFGWAQGKLGSLYRDGRGVEQSYDLAASWYQKAADNGDEEAFHALGILYANGQSVPQDYTQAIKWMFLAKTWLNKPRWGGELDNIARRAKAGEVAEGHRLANEWTAKRRRSQILLDCGITVKIKGLYIQDTYIGLLEGGPDKYYNQEIIDGFYNKAKRLWGHQMIHLIKPQITYRHYHPYLPPYAYAAWLISFDSEPEMTQLAVLWFSDLNLNKEFHSSVTECIKSINWKELAEEYSP